MTAPAWTWTDIFGDTLNVYEAGPNLVLETIQRAEGVPLVVSCVSLDPEQLSGLRAALGVHVRGGR
ncbi:hypothetical protein PBI_MRMAGOO_151 [Mycobacterium phage MrMagoo]|uniref:Uncharacterized protein n=1 Tax=Mycobacterium phage MrMagoo TaxID=1927020 RepID=A0A1L6BYR1_9CAUD|nr:hypothetical protein J4U04_gp129 [Mycobacterium phage MrMagoo]APQ42233.1 hypothetical protein PBI_MRMAGOO_151 [Mycobacterium phage MrMagoo]ARM70302.1 hypothetical protein SEA_GARDENSALSA_149 [Mycobacterium phage GardenSalsa]